MKKLTVALYFLFLSWNAIAQKYVYMDENCDIDIVVKFNAKGDSANLSMDFKNIGKGPILTGGLYYARLWGDRKMVIITFGEEFKAWHDWEYPLQQIRPDSVVHRDLWVKNIFTDSTWVAFDGSFVLVSSASKKVFTNKDFGYKDVKKFGFGFYPTYNWEAHKDK